jgi:hypothetical protein
VLSGALRQPFRLGLFFALMAFGALSTDPGAALGAPGQSASFSLRGSNGFVLDVSAEGGEVTVVASERSSPVPTFSSAGVPRRPGDGNGASSIYLAAAKATGPGVIDAGLGALGTIAVHFHPSGERTITTLRDCDRPVTLVRRLGTFDGTISFEGEDDYTTVAATSAKGSVGTPLPAGCKHDGGASTSSLVLSHPARSVGAILTAADPAAGSSFRAATGPAGVAFSARVRERNEDGVLVVRRAAAGAPLAAFDFNGALTRATVRPPAPFSGSAGFVSGGGPAWQGNLRVTFPGLSVPLTGAGFRPRLARP